MTKRTDIKLKNVNIKEREQLLGERTRNRNNVSERMKRSNIDM